MNQERLKSHMILPTNIEHVIRNITQRIKQQGDKPYATVAYQLELLAQLNQFDFGRYLLQNQGINGYWTHYMVTHPWIGRKIGKNNRGESLTSLENFVMNRMPYMLATQQRFAIFLKENQKQIKNQAKLACIPSGMMGELLYLDYSNITDICLLGIDYDPDVFDEARALAKQKNLLQFTKLVQQDAWHMDFKNEFDLISSNGLNIYEADDQKVTDLYSQFFKALKPNGKLVTSFLTYPPTLTEECEWEMSKSNQDDLLLQKIILIDIIAGKWSCYRSSEQTQAQLKSAGFKNIQFIYDDARMFPTVVAFKAFNEKH